MQLNQYTVDAICRSMGLGGFIERGAFTTLRVLFTPSFHPEMCITLIEQGESARLTAISFTEMLWRKPFPCPLPTISEIVSVSAAQCAELATNFVAAQAEIPPDVVICDGMPAHCCFATNANFQQFTSHAHTATQRVFLARLLDLAWTRCKRPLLRNAIANSARYIDIEYLLDTGEDSLPDRRLLVLGTCEAKSEYFDSLEGAPEAKE